MRSIPKMAFFLLGWGIALPPSWSAQSKQSSPLASLPVLNDQQRTGRNLFIKNCSLCHLPHKTENKSTDPGPAIGPLLNGLFHGQKPLSEQVVRTFILRGVPDKMPGFQYGLEPKEIDDIIAYLKTL